MSYSYTLTKTGVEKAGAFDAYIRANFSNYAGNSSTGELVNNLTIYSTAPFNEARKAALRDLIAAYVDPAVSYQYQTTKTAATSSETVLDGSDSGLFTPITVLAVRNPQDGTVVNKLVLVVHTEDIGGPSTQESGFSFKLRDLTQDTDVKTITGAPDGVATSDGAVVSYVEIADIANSYPQDQSLWELSCSVQGNLSVKVDAVQYLFYSLE